MRERERWKRDRGGRERRESKRKREQRKREREEREKREREKVCVCWYFTCIILETDIVKGRRSEGPASCEIYWARNIAV